MMFGTEIVRYLFIILALSNGAVYSFLRSPTVVSSYNSIFSLKCALRLSLSSSDDENLKNPMDALNGFEIFEEDSSLVMSDDDNLQMEREMALELFDELRGTNDRLLYEDFVQWDDIQDVLEKGLTLETIDVILKECRVGEPQIPIEIDGIPMDLDSINGKAEVDKSLDFDQFFDVVDLINQICIALEEGGDFEDMEMDMNVEEDDDEDRDVPEFLKNIQGLPQL